MKVWRTVESDDSLAAATARRFDLHLAAARAICALGIGSTDDVERFLNPRLADLGDPFLLPAIESASRRIWRAIEDGETIAIFGDYDVDGITSSGLLSTVLDRLGAGNVPIFLPSRGADGYGLTLEALNKCAAACHPRLLITVDCGTNADEAVAAAAAMGIDVVITDHHESAGSPCAAFAVVNPKLGDDESMKALAGVGVVFKLCHALVKMGRDRNQSLARDTDLRNYLGWVALGTVADIVPLLGENRTLVSHGLSRFARNCKAGLRELCEIAGIVGEINTFHIGYLLAPRLNAAGRVGSPEAALELLLTEDDSRAKELAVQLDAANRERQVIERAIQRDAEAEIRTWFDPTKHFGLVVGRAGWHPGVIGIVASRLAAVFSRPVAVVALDEDGGGRGSSRGIEGYHLLKGLAECHEHLAAFGGHEMAAGLEVKPGAFALFKTAFNDAAARELSARDLRPVLRISAWIGLSEADKSLLASLSRMGPFGMGNPEPIFAVRGVAIKDARPVANKHLKLTFSSNGTERRGVWFKMAGRKLPEGPVDVAFRVAPSRYAGKIGLELNVVDMRESG